MSSIWNWKSAILSAVVRSGLFFTVNLGAGIDAARAALVTEFLFRTATAGFYGALTQAFSGVRPAWFGTAAAMVVLPTLAHSLELLVHWLRGTALLGPSIAASVAFSMLSTAFNLFAMRRGFLVVGENARSIVSDLAETPKLIVAFVASMTGMYRSSMRR